LNRRKTNNLTSQMTCLNKLASLNCLDEFQRISKWNDEAFFRKSQIIYDQSKRKTSLNHKIIQSKEEEWRKKSIHLNIIWNAFQKDQKYKINNYCSDWFKEQSQTKFVCFLSLFYYCQHFVGLIFCIKYHTVNNFWQIFLFPIYLAYFST
jgi:hypothetical protein